MQAYWNTTSCVFVDLPSINDMFCFADAILLFTVEQSYCLPWNNLTVYHGTILLFTMEQSYCLPGTIINMKCHVVCSRHDYCYLEEQCHGAEGQ